MTEPIKEEAKVLYSGVVIYADAGVKPNPGLGGWGLHGYTYNDDKPKKGSGCQKAYVTKVGYQMREDFKGKDKPTEITPIRYLDAYGSISSSIDNNAAEIVAATNALRWAIEQPVKSITIYTDSENAVKGVNQYMPKWIANNWIKSDGNPVKNVEIWQRMNEQLQAAAAKGTPYEIKWIKGHNGHVGNECVDQYATMGRILGSAGVQKNQILSTEAEAYWDAAVPRSPLLNHPCSYLSTEQVTEKNNDYFLGTHGKEDDTLGVRTADGAYAYVVLPEACEAIEMLKDKVASLTNRRDRLLMFSLTTLFHRETLNRVIRFGEDCLYQPNPNKLSFFFPSTRSQEDDTPFCREINPPLIAHRAIEALSTIKGVFLRHQSGDDPLLVSTDLTDVFYEEGKKGLELKATIGSGQLSIPAQVKHCLKTQAAKETSSSSEHETSPVSLTFSIDLPDRNTLKRIEKEKPKITAVTWPQSERSFRYAIVIETNIGRGIWCGYYTNLMLLK